MKQYITGFSILMLMQPAVKADCISRLAGHQVQEVYQHALTHEAGELRVLNVDKKGFVVMAADRLVGYAEQGSFDPQTAPPALLSWLEAVADAWQLADAVLSESETAADEGLHFSPVAPLLGETRWNQDAPYNDLCPKYDFTNVSPTGCVATAMAQVMFYHRWPEQGTGSHTYQPAVLRGNELSANFGETRYAWDLMLPSYDASSSEASRQAVAELMLHCGVSVDMEYYTASGALDLDVPPALTSYFGYGSQMAYRKREHYGTADWLALIHDELMAGRPVLAYGRANSGGHAYVFDGMDSDGLIHVNWGWGGMCNGYFQTSALTPATQGIGGSDGGFNYSQRIITGIEPQREGEAVKPFAVELTSSEGLVAQPKRLSNGGTTSLKLAGKVKNHGWRASTFDYGVQLVTLDGEVLLTVEGPKQVSLDQEAECYGPSFGQVTLPELADGSYRLYPVCRDSESTGDWERIRDHYIGYPNYLRVKVSQGQVTLEAPDYFSLKATIDQQPEIFYWGVPALVRATVKNEGDVEYHGEVRLTLSGSNTPRQTSTNHIIDLLPGEECQVQFDEAYLLDAGQYTMALIDDDGQRICSQRTVTFAQETIGKPIAAAPMHICLEEGELKAEATIEAQQGLVGGLLYTYIYDRDGATLCSCLYPTYYIVEKGQSVKVEMQGKYEHAQLGQTYKACLVNFDGYGSTFVDGDDATCLFVYGGEEALETLSADAPAPERRIDLWGRPATPNTKLWLKAKK